VAEAQLLDGLGEVTHGGWIGAELNMGKDNADFH
jgi:hypothetical protein